MPFRLRLHASLRWVGIGLFLLAVPGVFLLATRIATGASPLRQIPFCILALALSLTAFGTNNDTAVHHMREAAREGALPAAFRAELDHERRVRRVALGDVHASPKTALVTPALAAAAIAWLCYLLSTGG